MAKPLYEIKRPTEMKSYRALSEFFQEKPVKGNNKINKILKEEQLERFRQFYDIKVRIETKKTVYTIYPKDYQSKNSMCVAKKAKRKTKLKELNIQDTIVIDDKEYDLDNPKRIIKDYFYPYVVTSAIHAKINSKSDFYHLLFYPTQFYQQLYKKDSFEFYLIINKYGLEVIQAFEQIVSSRLFKIIDYQIEKMVKQSIIDVQTNFRDNKGNFIKKDLIDEFDKKILKENDWSNVGSIMQSLKGRAKFFSLRNKYYSEFIGEKRKIKQETHFHDTKVAEEIFDKNLYDLEEDLEKQLNYLENFLTYMRQRIIFLMQTKDIDFESGAEDKIDRIKDKTKEEIDIADNSNINFNSDFKNITIQSIKSLLDMFTCNYKGVKNIYIEILKLFVTVICTMNIISVL